MLVRRNRNALIIQSSVRMHFVRREFVRFRRSICILQVSAVPIVDRDPMGLLASSSFNPGGQVVLRTDAPRRVYTHVCHPLMYPVWIFYWVVQSLFRGARVREHYKHLSSSVVDIQRVVRGRLARKLLSRKKRRRAMGCSRIQAFARMVSARSRYTQLRSGITKFQAYVRRRLAKGLLDMMRVALLILQSQFRMVR